MLTFNVGLSSFSAALLNDLLNGKLDVLLNHIEEISVRDLPCLLEVDEFKNLEKVLISHNHISVLQQSLKIAGLHHPVLVSIEHGEPVAYVFTASSYPPL